MCIWIFEYRTRYLYIASFELGTRRHRKSNNKNNNNSENKKEKEACLDFCILHNGAYDYFKFARAKYCAYAAWALDEQERDRPSLDNDNADEKAAHRQPRHTHTQTVTQAARLKRG